LQLIMLIDLGPLAAGIIVLSVVTSLLVSVYLGKLLGYPLKFSLLIGAGNGICGSSAIAATSSAIEADGDDIGISISVVNLLGTAGIFTLPAIVSLLNLGEIDGGMLIGGTLQAVGQVVAAGFSMNDTVGSVATVVKMGRVLMLAPVVIALASIVRSGNAEDGKSLNPLRVPLFIIGFFVFSLVASLNVLPEPAIGSIRTTGKFLLVLAMAGIGMRIQLQTLFRSGPKALAFGLGVSVVQIAMVLLLVLLV
ncbi:MAG: putative sulfate exporter family transporter, partial [Chloroflexota bacterium]